MTVKTIPPIPPEGGMTVKQVLAHLQICRAYLYILIREGKFPQPRKLGRRSIWPAEEVREWLFNRPVALIGDSWNPRNPVVGSGGGLRHTVR